MGDLPRTCFHERALWAINNYAHEAYEITNEKKKDLAHTGAEGEKN